MPALSIPTISPDHEQYPLKINTRDAHVIFEHFFTGVFALEMCLKMCVSFCDYFKCWWNVLDFVIAWVSIVSAWVLPWLHNRVDSRMSVIRVFRLLRLLRIFKIMKAIPELRIVVEGLVG